MSPKQLDKQLKEFLTNVSMQLRELEPENIETLDIYGVLEGLDKITKSNQVKKIGMVHLTGINRNFQEAMIDHIDMGQPNY
jgi:hypothetical protein